MKRLLLLIATAACLFQVAEAQPTMEGPSYCQMRSATPTRSPFVTMGYWGDTIPSNALLQWIVGGVGYGPKCLNNSPGEWKVYKDYEVQDWTNYTKDNANGSYRYYNRTINEYRLGMGTRMRQYSAPGVLLRDTGWVDGKPDPVTMFDDRDWDASNEQNTTVSQPSNVTFYTSRQTSVNWKFANIYPNLMSSDCEYLLLWRGYTWQPAGVYETAQPQPTGYIRFSAGVYPRGAAYIWIRNPQSPNTKVNGYPTIVDAGVPMICN